MMQLLPLEFSQKLIGELLNKTNVKAAQPSKKKAPAEKAFTAKPETPKPEPYPLHMDAPAPAPVPGPTAQAQAQPQIPVAPVHFERFEVEPVQVSSPSNLNITGCWWLSVELEPIKSQRYP